MSTIEISLDWISNPELAPLYNLSDIFPRMRVKCLSLSRVQLFWDPMDCSWPGFSVHGISQARILEWVEIPFSRSSQPRDQTWVFCIAGRFFTIWDTREAHFTIMAWYGCENFDLMLPIGLMSSNCHTSVYSSVLCLVTTKIWSNGH